MMQLDGLMMLLNVTEHCSLDIIVRALVVVIWLRYIRRLVAHLLWICRQRVFDENIRASVENSDIINRPAHELFRRNRSRDMFV